MALRAAVVSRLRRRRRRERKEEEEEEEEQEEEEEEVRHGETPSSFDQEGSWMRDSRCLYQPLVRRWMGIVRGRTRKELCVLSTG